MIAAGAPAGARGRGAAQRVLGGSEKGADPGVEPIERAGARVGCDRGGGGARREGLVQRGKFDQSGNGPAEAGGVEAARGEKAGGGAGEGGQVGGVGAADEGAQRTSRQAARQQAGGLRAVAGLANRPSKRREFPVGGGGSLVERGSGVIEDAEAELARGDGEFRDIAAAGAVFQFEGVDVFRREELAELWILLDPKQEGSGGGDCGGGGMVLGRQSPRRGGGAGGRHGRRGAEWVRAHDQR